LPQQQRLQAVLLKGAAAAADAAAANSATAGTRSSSARSGTNGGGSSSSSGVSGIVGGFGFYSAWVLLGLLMDEWVQRVVANGQHMAQLRR
jgi:hypothetical protein